MGGGGWVWGRRVSHVVGGGWGCCAGGEGGGEGAQLALLEGGQRPEAVGDHAVVLAEVPAHRRQAHHRLAAAVEELHPQDSIHRFVSGTEKGDGHFRVGEGSITFM